MRNVGDMHPKFPLVAGEPLQTNGIVEILGIIWINSDNEISAAIRPSAGFMRMHHSANFPGFLQDVLGKMERQLVLAQHRKHVHSFFVGRSEDFDDFAFWICMARFPFS